MKRPRWIIVSGPRRTGSTLVYNAIRLALPQKSAIGLVDAWVCDRITRVRPEVDTVVKVHDWVVETIPETACYVTSIRNPADTQFSLERFKQTVERVSAEMEAAERIYRYLAPGAVKFRYEAYHADPLMELGHLMRDCEINVYPETLGYIGVLLAPNYARHLDDPLFELRPNHISQTLGEPGLGKPIDLSPYPAWAEFYK